MEQLKDKIKEKIDEFLKLRNEADTYIAMIYVEQIELLEWVLEELENIS